MNRDLNMFLPQPSFYPILPSELMAGSLQADAQWSPRSVIHTLVQSPPAPNWVELCDHQDTGEIMNGVSLQV